VWGYVDLGAGDNILTVNNGGHIYGDVYSSGTLKILFTINGKADTSAMIQTADVQALDDDTTNYSLNLADMQIGQYLLIASADLSSMIGKEFTIDGETSTITVNGEDVTINGQNIHLSVVEGTNVDHLVLNVGNATGNIIEPAYQNGTVIDTAQTGALRLKENVSISENGSLKVGTSDKRATDQYALRIRGNNKILSLSGDISLYSSSMAYGVDFGTNSGKLILGNKALNITANGNGTAYGLYLKDLNFENGGSDSHLTITATGSTAYGIYGGNSISEEFNWDVTARGTSSAYALYGTNLDFAAGFSGTLNTTTTSSYTGVGYGICGNSLAVSSDMAGTITTTSVGTTVRGISVTDDITIGGDFTSKLTTTLNYYSNSSQDGFLRGISAKKLSVAGNMAGEIKSTNNAYYAGDTYGIKATTGIYVDKDFASKITVSASPHYFLYAADGESSNHSTRIAGVYTPEFIVKGNYSGDIGVTGSGGNQSYFSVYGIFASQGVIEGNYSGSISVSSNASYPNSSTSYTREAYGLYSGTSFEIQGNVTEDGTFKAIGTNTANATAVYAKKLTVDGDFAGNVEASSQSGAAYGLNGSITVNGDFSGDIKVSTTSGTAYGISGSLFIGGSYSGDISSVDYGVKLTTFGIDKAFSGNISVTDSSTAYGIYTGYLRVGTVFSGTVKSTGYNTSGTGTAYGIYAATKTYGNTEEDALVISGTILANGRSNATALYGNQLNVSISGTLFGGSYKLTDQSALTSASAMDALQIALTEFGNDGSNYRELYISGMTGIQAGSEADKVEILSTGKVWG
ncbi:MAG: hypothetical protein J6U97_00945, partial [Bacteroidaceae bacterium]|nr:hypothetical protein [Bacteroidaceae bacterium]